AAVPPSAYGVVEAQLSKALPSRFRIALSDLTLRERLRFRPAYSSLPPLTELLSRFTVETAGRKYALRDLFLVPDTAPGEQSPTPYADCLPSLPREMENLYYSFDGLAASDQPDTTAAVRSLISTAVAAGFQRTPLVESSPERIVRFERSPIDAGKQTLAI